MSYRVNEIFTSLQGEGRRKGTVNTFVRFSGCNLQCRADGPEGFDCDTEFTSGVTLDRSDLVDLVVANWHDATGRDSKTTRPWVILTGGEPGLQVDEALVEALHAANCLVAIETNGTQPLPDFIDWISCSPKSADHTIRVGDVHELRYVRHAGQGIPKPPVQSEWKYLSPAFGADGQPTPGALATCVALCLKNPDWALSTQDHKRWGLR